MPDVTLYCRQNQSATSISNRFIDEYMPDANGEFVKIYLYLLRHLTVAGCSFSLADIAEKFEHTEKDVKRALLYWERMQLLKLTYDDQGQLAGIELLDIPSSTGEPAVPSEKADAPILTVSVTCPKPVTPRQKTYSADEVSKFRDQESIRELLFLAERYLGRMLSSTDVQAILYWYDGLHFSAELIEYLIEYCVGKGHTGIRYIEKVALAWHEAHIATVEEAKAASGQYNQTYNLVMRSLGITGRKLVAAETDFIDRWKTDYGFSPELISAACQRTIQNTHQPSFEYADSILKNWQKQHVCTLDDVAKLDSAHQQKKKTQTAASDRPTARGNKFNNFNQRSYDYDELEKILLTTPIQ